MSQDPFDRGVPPKFVAVMVALCVGAVVGQLITMRALVSFNKEKTVWEGREEERDRLESRIATLNGELSAAESSRDAAQQSEAKARVELQAVEQAVNIAQAELARAREQREKDEAASRDATLKSATERNALSSLQEQIGALERERLSQESRAEDVKQSLATLQGQKAAYEGQIDERKRLLTALQKDYDEAKSSTEAEWDSYQSLVKKRASVESELRLAEDQIAKAAELRSSMTSLEIQLESTKGAILSAEKKRDSLLLEAQSQSNELDRLESELSSKGRLREDLNAVKQDIASLERQRDRLEVEVAGLTERKKGLDAIGGIARVDQLETEVAGLELEIESFKATRKRLVEEIATLHIHAGVARKLSEKGESPEKKADGSGESGGGD